jgi:hypothetical protein
MTGLSGLVVDDARRQMPVQIVVVHDHRPNVFQVPRSVLNAKLRPKTTPPISTSTHVCHRTKKRRGRQPHPQRIPSEDGPQEFSLWTAAACCRFSVPQPAVGPRTLPQSSHTNLQQQATEANLDCGSPAAAFTSHSLLWDLAPSPNHLTQISSSRLLKPIWTAAACCRFHVPTACCGTSHPPPFISHKSPAADC